MQQPFSPRPPTFARPTSAITASLRAPSPTPFHSPTAIPEFTRSLRAVKPLGHDGVHAARLVRRVVLSKDDPLLISKTEPAFPHEIDKARTRPQTAFGVPSRRTTSFSGNRPWGAPLPTERSSLSASFASMTASGNSMSNTNSSGNSFGSTTTSKSSSRVAPMTVTMPDTRPRVSNYPNDCGRSRWTGTGSPGNRSYYRACQLTQTPLCYSDTHYCHACDAGLSLHRRTGVDLSCDRFSLRQPSPMGATPFRPGAKASPLRPRGERIVFRLS